MKRRTWPGRSPRFQRVGRLIDWNLFELELHRAVLPPAKGPGGKPRLAPLLMFKILVLPKLHGLADDATSFPIADRRSFRAFLNLTPADRVPDGQTILDFRNALAAAGGFEKLFAVFLARLQARGLALAREGVIVDASFVDVPRGRKTPRSRRGKSRKHSSKRPNSAPTRTATRAGPKKEKRRPTAIRTTAKPIGGTS